MQQEELIEKTKHFLSGSSYHHVRLSTYRYLFSFVSFACIFLFDIFLFLQFGGLGAFEMWITFFFMMTLGSRVWGFRTLWISSVGVWISLVVGFNWVQKKESI